MKKILFIIFIQGTVISYSNNLNHKTNKKSSRNLKVMCTTLACSNEIGKRVLARTNRFRVNQGKSRLVWNQKIANLSRQHSIDMGKGKVPFGHAGFAQRVRKFPKPAKGAAENVFLCICNRVARTAVNAWKRSSGHRVNLLGRYNNCGVGVYQNSRGVWYVTQEFALF